MPICPRCGKCLSSEQALTYHLNRKYKCGTWNCTSCATNFSTKFQLQIHEMTCIGDRNPHHQVGYQHPSTDTLLRIYKTLPVVIIELDVRTKLITNVSPQFEPLFGVSNTCIMGKLLNDSLEIMEAKQKVSVYEMGSDLVCITPGQT